MRSIRCFDAVGFREVVFYGLGRGKGWRLVDTHGGIMVVIVFWLWEGCFMSGYMRVARVWVGRLGICSHLTREGTGTATYRTVDEPDSNISLQIFDGARMGILLVSRSIRDLEHSSLSDMFQS